MQSEVASEANPELKTEAVVETEAASETEAAQETKAAVESSTASISAVGDIMFMIAQNNAAYRYGSGTYNYDYMFAQVAPIISSADIAMGNLEAPVAPSVSVAVDGARFNAPEGAITSLKRAGFDYVSTANNHAADAGRAGLLQTLSLLDKHGMKHSGTNSSRAGKRYVVMQAQGIRFGILSYTFSFSRRAAIGGDASWMINFINESNIRADIAAARNEGADAVLVNMHWDREYTASTSADTKAMADRILYYGADAIIGHHPHTLQPMVKKTVTDQYGQRKQRFIAYSLGNFISNIDRANSDMTCILQLQFTKDSTGTRLSDASYVPVYFYRTAGHRLLPIERTLNNASLMSSLPAGAGARLTVAQNYIKYVLGQSAARSVSGTVITGKWEQSGGKWYYKLSNGKYHTGWLNERGSWYYLQPGGAMASGWQSIGSKWYHFSARGVMAVGWLQVDAKWYLMGSDGAMLRGWQRAGGNWYFMESSGEMRTGWLNAGGKWYFLHGNGVMAAGWVKQGGDWYRFGYDGAMRTGWFKSGNDWYYLKSDGRMQTGWLRSGSAWYFLTANGAMKRGWQHISGSWFHFEYSGVMSTGWKQLGGKWYHFAADGRMSHDTVVDGYRLDSNGVWVQ